MKVLIISDTHHQIKNAIYLLDMLKSTGVSTLIHCGDHIDDAFRLQSLYPEISVHAVYGNCDGMAYGEDCTKVIEIEEIPIFITHGHKYGIKWGDYSDLLIDAEAEGAKIVLYGHSHTAYLKKEKGIILLNPGSITSPRDSSHPSYAVIELEKGSIKNIGVMQIQDGSRVCMHPICGFYKN